MATARMHEPAGLIQPVVSRAVHSFLDVFVLEMLRSQSRHGYEIMRELETRTGTRVSPGTLYPLLYALEAKGLITGTWIDSIRRDRRVYNITSRGLAYRQHALQSMGRLLPSPAPNLPLNVEEEAITV